MMCIPAYTCKSIIKTKESSVPPQAATKECPGAWQRVLSVSSTGAGCLPSQDTPPTVAMYIVTTSDYLDHNQKYYRIESV